MSGAERIVSSAKVKVGQFELAVELLSHRRGKRKFSNFQAAFLALAGLYPEAIGVFTCEGDRKEEPQRLPQSALAALVRLPSPS